MIRSRQVLVAPSPCTLHFLRQIVYPRPSDPTIFTASPNCLRTAASPLRPPRVLRYHRLYSTLTVENTISTPDLEPAIHDASYNSGRYTDSYTDSFTEPFVLKWPPIIPAGEPPYDPKIHDKFVASALSDSVLHARKLIDQKKLDNAKEFYFGLREKYESEIEIHQIGRDLMRALNAAGRFAEIPKVFTYMATGKGLYAVPAQSLNKCLDAYARGGRWEKLVSTFTHHTRRTVPNEWTYELLMEALVKMRKMDTAWELIERLEGSNTPANYAIFNLYLKGLRALGTSLEELMRVYETIKGMYKQRGQIVPLAVLNVMLEEALLAGKPELAQHFVMKMKSSGLAPNRDTYDAFLSAHAAIRDWDSVAVTMETMKQKHLRIRPAKTNYLLRVFSREHDAEQTATFLEAMEKEGAELNTTSYNILIERFADENKFEKVLDIIKGMGSLGKPPNAMTIRSLHNMLRTKNIHQRHQLQQMMKKIYEVHPSLTNSGTSLDKYYQELSDIYPTFNKSDEEPFHEIMEAMEIAIQEGRPFDALSIFREHLPPPQVRLPARLLDAVVSAFIALPDPDETASTPPPDNTRDVRKIPFQTAYLIEHYMARLIDKAIGESEPPLPFVIASYKFKDFYNMPISHSTVTHAASTYCNRSHPLKAVHIMNEISKTSWGRKVPWDFNGLTILLRAYSIMKDTRGAAWVVNRLINGNFIPDRRVMVYLSDASRGGEAEMRKAVEQLGQWLNWHRDKVRSGLKEPFWETMKEVLKGGIKGGSTVRENQLIGGDPGMRKRLREKKAKEEQRQQEMDEAYSTPIRRVKPRAVIGKMDAMERREGKGEEGEEGGRVGWREIGREGSRGERWEGGRGRGRVIPNL